MTENAGEDYDDRLLFNQRMTARLCGISVQALSNWDVQPVEYRGKEALYYWPQARDELVRRRGEVTERPLRARIGELEDKLDAANAPFDPDEDDRGYSLEGERARLAAEQADQIAMKNALTRGEIAYLPDVAKEQARVFEMIRARALALPTKVAALANPENPNVARDAVEREVFELLGEIARAVIEEEPVERETDVRGVALDSDPAAEADGDGVGGLEAAAQPRKQRRTRAMEN